MVTTVTAAVGLHAAPSKFREARAAHFVELIFVELVLVNLQRFLRLVEILVRRFWNHRFALMGTAISRRRQPRVLC
ncbi:MAG: hypothetical protein JO302_01410 [Candidatus Eremiobacteraeota bacterium]|nr:hypothetical protein [Candidatus Eremiobacteraeota bacterium]